MKLTKQRLIEIVKEELQNLKESPMGRAQMHAKGLSKDALRLATYLKKGDVDKARYFIKDIIDSLKEVERYTRKNDAAYVSLKKGPLTFKEEKLNEAKQTQFQIPYREQKNVMKILRKGKSAMVGKYKEGKHYDFGVGKGPNFILAVDKKLEDEILSLLIQKGIRNINEV